VPLPGACEVSSRMGGLAGGFDLSRMEVLMILSSPGIPKCTGSGSCRNRIVCNICEQM
jgi:hypothetical protein